MTILAVEWTTLSDEEIDRLHSDIDLTIEGIEQLVVACSGAFAQLGTLVSWRERLECIMAQRRMQ